MARRLPTCRDVPMQQSLQWETIDPLAGLSIAEERRLVAIVAELLVDAVKLARRSGVEEKSDE